jgi:hypothetical protein
MNALTRFRDHCRAMAGASSAVNVGSRDRPEWAFPTDDERELWARLADEIDAYLTRDDPPVPDTQPGFDFGELR